MVITWWSQTGQTQTWHSLLQYPPLGACKSCIQVCTCFAHGLHGTSGTVLRLPVLVPDIKTAEDLNLGPFTTPAAVVADSLLHAPHQPSDLTPTQLIVFPVRRRKAEASKPVAAIVVQVMGDFVPEVLENPMLRDVVSVSLSRLGMLRDVVSVSLSRLGSPNLFAQGCKSIVVAVIITTMQRMSHPVRSPRPPPNIALECIC
jgi:hypothetical protein